MGFTVRFLRCGWLCVLGMFHVERGGLFGVVVVVLWVGIVLP